MLFTSLFFLALTAVSWQFAQKHPDEVGRILGSFSSIVCIVICLITAPILLKGLLFLGVILYPGVVQQRRAI